MNTKYNLYRDWEAADQRVSAYSTYMVITDSVRREVMCESALL